MCYDYMQRDVEYGVDIVHEALKACRVSYTVCAWLEATLNGGVQCRYFMSYDYPHSMCKCLAKCSQKSRDDE